MCFPLLIRFTSFFSKEGQVGLRNVVKHEENAAQLFLAIPRFNTEFWL